MCETHGLVVCEIAAGPPELTEEDVSGDARPIAVTARFVQWRCCSDPWEPSVHPQLRTLFGPAGTIIVTDFTSVKAYWT
jgi:hypothetical protein